MKFTSFVYLCIAHVLWLCQKKKHVSGENCAAIHIQHFFLLHKVEEKLGKNTSQI